MVERKDLGAELAALCVKLNWLVTAMQANEDNPAAEVLDGITRQFDALVEPVAELQAEVRA